MELAEYFRGMIEYGENPIVICDLDYRIIYLNRKAREEYSGKRNYELLGSSIRLCFDEEARSKIDMSVEWFKEDERNNKVFSYHDDENDSDVYIKALRDMDGKLIGFYNFIVSRKNETGKAYDLD